MWATSFVTVCETRSRHPQSSASTIFPEIARAREKSFQAQTVEVKKVDLLSIDKSIDYKPPVELFQVKIDVFWKSGAKEKSMSVESLKAMKPEEGEKKS